MPESSVPISGPTAALVIRLKDFDDARALFGEWRGRFEQLTCGRFEGMLRVVRGPSVRVVAVEANQRVLLRGRDNAGLFAVYPITAGNAASVWQGRRLTPGQLVVHGTDAEVDHYSARRTKDLGISLRPAVLEEAARVLTPAAVALPQTWAAFSPPPSAIEEFNNRVARLLGMGLADPAILRTPEGHQLEQECVRSLVAALFSASTPRPDLPLPARSLVLRRAEEFMRVRLAAPVGAIDLCREVGVSDRTLRLAFRERFGLGPMAYYRCLRLNTVRSRLKTDPIASIADVARAYGFHHLGNFAAAYRRLFGERPSSTPLPTGP